MFGGRDVRFMKRVADETGVRIVACTGIYSYDYLPHYFANRDVDAMADHFIEDIECGIQGTDIKAAFLKCAADAAGVTENVEKIHRAVARASVQTGAPIMAHSMPAVATGPRQVEIFEEEGVDLARVQIAHCGDSEDVGYIEGLLEQGVYVGLDRYGLEMFLPIDKRNATAAELLRRGHAERLMISQDFCATIDWFPPEVAETARKQRHDPQLVDDARLRRGRAGAARAGRDGRRGLPDDLRGEPQALADRVAPGLCSPRTRSRPRCGLRQEPSPACCWTGAGSSRWRPATSAKAASLSAPKEIPEDPETCGTSEGGGSGCAGRFSIMAR